ncbi:phage portal protein family protein [Ruegeria sp.]|uniref:phage portal protein family protein n=1 Tax=Ruegeria sp. TaxID=1879320 RepID=UPI003B004835
MDPRDSDVPKRPDTAERAAPAQTARLGGTGIWGQTAGWLEGLGSALAGGPGGFGGVPGDDAGLDAAEIALTDSKATAVLGQRIDGLLAAPLVIEPGGTRARDVAAADDLRLQLGGLDMNRVSRALLHAIWYGYAISECLWAVEGHRVRLVDIRSRDPRLIRHDRTTLEPLLITRSHPAGIPLPPAKYILHRTPPRHGGQPFGLGAAHWCIWPVWLKRQVLRMWSVALEKFGAPVLVGKYRQDALQPEIDALLAIMGQAVTASCIALPEGQSVETLAAAGSGGGAGGRGSGGGDFRSMLSALDRMIAEAVVGQHATSEIGQHVGTARVQNETLQALIASDEHRLSECLHASVATWLTHWNFPGAAVPRLYRDTAPPEDLEIRAKRDYYITQASGLRPARSYIEETYGGVWEEPAPRPDRPPDMSDPTAEFAAPPGGAPGDAITGLVGHLIGPDIATEAAAATLIPVQGALDEAETLQALRDRLAELATHPAAEALAGLYARADFAAQLAGTADAPVMPESDPEA